MIMMIIMTMRMIFRTFMKKMIISIFQHIQTLNLLTTMKKKDSTWRITLSWGRGRRLRRSGGEAVDLNQLGKIVISCFHQLVRARHKVQFIQVCINSSNLTEDRPNISMITVTKIVISHLNSSDKPSSRESKQSELASMGMQLLRHHHIKVRAQCPPTSNQIQVLTEHMALSNPSSEVKSPVCEANREVVVDSMALIKHMAKARTSLVCIKHSPSVSISNSTHIRELHRASNQHIHPQGRNRRQDYHQELHSKIIIMANLLQARIDTNKSLWWRLLHLLHFLHLLGILRPKNHSIRLNH